MDISCEENGTSACGVTNSNALSISIRTQLNIKEENPHIRNTEDKQLYADSQT
jgi:hypothetical protein